MNKRILMEKLKDLGACQSALHFVNDSKSVRQAYETAYRHHLIWLIFKIDPTPKKWELLKDLLKTIEGYMVYDATKAVFILLDEMITTGNAPSLELHYRRIYRIVESYPGKSGDFFAAALCAYHATMAIVSASKGDFVSTETRACSVVTSHNFNNAGELIRAKYSLNDLIALLEVV